MLFFSCQIWNFSLKELANKKKHRMLSLDHLTKSFPPFMYKKDLANQPLLGLDCTWATRKTARLNLST